MKIVVIQQSASHDLAANREKGVRNLKGPPDREFNPWSFLSQLEQCPARRQFLPARRPDIEL